MEKGSDTTDKKPIYYNKAVALNINENRLLITNRGFKMWFILLVHSAIRACGQREAGG